MIIPRILLRSFPRPTHEKYLFSKSILSIRKIGSWTNPVFQEGDVVLLEDMSQRDPVPILTKPIYPGVKIHTAKGDIEADKIIGSKLRDSVVTSKGKKYRMCQPSISEYTDLSPREVTPIYSQDASLIVSLLDLHPTIPGSQQDERASDRLEIFEAGTGEGALTLHLSRAIHGANTVPPLRRDGVKTTTREDDTTVVSRNSDSREPDLAQEAYDAWLANRRAVVHTLDLSPGRSAHARRKIQAFRSGMYVHNIDFHSGTIDEYVSNRLEGLKTPFLNYAILDLPDPQTYLDIIAKAMKPNGVLVTFSPSITQINSVVIEMSQKHSPFFLKKVIELGFGIGSGGKEWDVRPIKPRQLIKAEAAARADSNLALESGILSDAESFVSTGSPENLTKGWELICRPKVGTRVVGGGFLSVWVRKSDLSQD